MYVYIIQFSVITRNGNFKYPLNMILRVSHYNSAKAQFYLQIISRSVASWDYSYRSGVSFLFISTLRALKQRNIYTAYSLYIFIQDPFIHHHISILDIIFMIVELLDNL